MNMDMDMDMDMGGAISEYQAQTYYWAVVGSVIAAFAIVNLYSIYLARHRYALPMIRIQLLSIANRMCRRLSKNQSPAKPRKILTVSIASIAAILRESSNASITLFRFRSKQFAIPTIGKTSLVVGNLVTLIILGLYGYDTSDWTQWEKVGYRMGRMTLCQLPLLFLLAGKRNIIGILIGSSYERLNWLHRWASRCMLIIATIHMGFWFANWNKFKYIPTAVAGSVITQRGLIAWGVLIWITVSSTTPIRGWCYEFFVIQHIISFVIFIAFVYLHVPSDGQKIIWICVAFFVLDRVLRGLFYLYNNIHVSWFSKSTGRAGQKLFGQHAEFKALSGGCTLVTIRNPKISWKPGQHVFVSCHSLAPLQAHPFTICSIPSDRKMEFIIQSRTGGTRRLFIHASGLLPTNIDEGFGGKNVVIEGPYGHIRPLQQFDSVLLVAGSTGATFTLPLLRDIVQSWKLTDKVVTRFVKYIWIIKSGSNIEWFKTKFDQVIEDKKELASRGIDVNVTITIYITCDETFTQTHMNPSTNVEKSKTCDTIIDSPMTEGMIQADKTLSKIIVETHPQHSKCCCRGEIDENADNEALPICTCTCCGVPSDSIQAIPSESSISTTTNEKSISTSIDTLLGTGKPITSAIRVLHPEIQLFSGRPKLKDVMRSVLEQARGESAVLACGPKGLTRDVRKSYVELCDERAVHKGTGAQGVWLHLESYGY